MFRALRHRAVIAVGIFNAVIGMYPKRRRHAAFGSWASPITADTIVADSLGLGQVVLDGADVYWSETRPVERGRNAVVCWRGGVLEERLPAPYSARSRVHEYGGGAFTVADGVLYFCNDADQRIYRAETGVAPFALTLAGSSRYADLTIDRARRRLIAVCEEHAETGVRNSIVAVPLSGTQAPQTLVAGADFYAAPRFSSDGRRFAWLNWNHPDMPWDGTELWLADVDARGGLVNARRVAGSRDESVSQPLFGPDGLLYFISDRSGWWNLYRLRESAIEPLAAMDADVGWPQWIFGESTYAFASAHEAIIASNCRGTWKLSLFDLASGRLRDVPTPHCEFRTMVAAHGRAAFVAASTNEPAAVIQLDPQHMQFTTLRRSTATATDADYLSAPEPIEFVTAHGEIAYGFYYPPANRDFTAPRDEQPPLLVLSHGGPTAATSPALNLKLQYWTSRGFAVLDVNYRGSTGFGRAYRRALYGEWGVADVDDCVHGARYMVERGRVDAARLAIRGGSAGGYTTLCALAFHDTFRAGAVYYGVSDLEALARETHKFEQHYLDWLIGPYPQRRDLYTARSPIHHAARLACPVIFFQGLDDKVVPPDQTEMMVHALRAKRIPVACVEFEGEAHGFRRAASIKRALEAELYFYSRVFGFTPADAVAPVRIENL